MERLGYISGQQLSKFEQILDGPIFVEDLEKVYRVCLMLTDRQLRLLAVISGIVLEAWDKANCSAD